MSVQAARGVAAEDGDQLRAQRRRLAAGLAAPEFAAFAVRAANEGGHRAEERVGRPIEIVGRTGCTTLPLEKRWSADAIVSIRSSIDRTALTSVSVRRRKRIDTGLLSLNLVIGNRVIGSGDWMIG